MTLIVSPQNFASKDALKQKLDEGCILHEPSIMGEWTKLSTDLPVGFKGTVTNHPKRTKFAQIEKRSNGWMVK